MLNFLRWAAMQILRLPKGSIISEDYRAELWTTAVQGGNL